MRRREFPCYVIQESAEKRKARRQDIRRSLGTIGRLPPRKLIVIGISHQPDAIQPHQQQTATHSDQLDRVHGDAQLEVYTGTDRSPEGPQFTNTQNGRTRCRHAAPSEHSRPNEGGPDHRPCGKRIERDKNQGNRNDLEGNIARPADKSLDRTPAQHCRVGHEKEDRQGGESDQT